MDWALATTLPNTERVASAGLLRRGYEHWLFKRLVIRARRGRIIETYLPAFPRYIFVPFAAAWEVLVDVERIIGLVCFGERVARVEGHEVEQLVERCGGGDVLPRDAIREPYRRGDQVHVGGIGLLAGYDVTYDGLAGDGKLRVLFDLMGKPTPVDVEVCDVTSVSNKQNERRQKRRRRGRGHKSSH